MEPEIKNVLSQNNQLNQITPVSKYLAMLLFIILPFLGGWIGYNFIPVKVVETKEFVTEEVERLVANQNSWYLHMEEGDFSLLVPNPYQVIPIDGGITVTDGRGLLDGYNIYYQEEIENEEQAMNFARKVYGTDCEVLPAYPNEKYRTNYEPRDYFVIAPDLDVLPDQRKPNNCRAMKVSFLYEPYKKRVLTWHRWMEAIMPIEANIRTSGISEEVSSQVIYADFIMLNSIKFEY